MTIPKRTIGQWLAAIILAVAPGFTLRAATFEVAQRNPQARDDAPGTMEQPFKTISAAVAKAAAGDVVVVRGGVYRERVLVKNSGTTQAAIRIEAAPGEQVVVTGADRMSGWTKVDEARPVYRIAWPHKFIGWNKRMTHPDDARHELIGRAEQVFVNGYALRQVLSRDQLAPGTFFADVVGKALFVWDGANGDLNKAEVEASVRTEIFHVAGDYVAVRGLRFRYAANAAQQGAVVLAGHHDTMEDCVVEKINAEGASFTGEDAVVRRCVFRANGQIGFGGNRAHRLLMTDCTIEENNTKDFDRGWEAGGFKLCMCRDVVIERCRIERNRGNGLWFDIGNEHATVRNCLITDNEDAGIFYEISYGLHAQDNVIVGNGFAETRGAWGAQAGICLSSSPDCVIGRNLLVGNREGFNFREQTRTTTRIDASGEHSVWNHDEMVRNNVIALNRDWQVAGWFDATDHRHWPKNTAQAATNSPPANDRSDLTLEKLNLRFEGNVYFAAPGQGLFQWGVPWHEHKRFDSLDAFRQALDIDRSGRVIEPRFVDLLARDLRLAPDAAAALRDCYPRGPVPAVIPGAEHQ